MSTSISTLDNIVARAAELLTPERVNAWLLALPEGSLVGFACRARECPIQRYLSTVAPVGGYWIVGTGRAVALDDTHQELSFRFTNDLDWVTNYIARLDAGLPIFASISREYALNRLMRYL
jgi:hypothetical protein